MDDIDKIIGGLAQCTAGFKLPFKNSSLPFYSLILHHTVDDIKWSDSWRVNAVNTELNMKFLLENFKFCSLCTVIFLLELTSH